MRAASLAPTSALSPLDLLSEYERHPFERALSPTPIKYGRWGPRSSEVAYDEDGKFLCVFLMQIPHIHHREIIFFSLVKSTFFITVDHVHSHYTAFISDAHFEKKKKNKKLKIY